VSPERGENGQQIVSYRGHSRSNWPLFEHQSPEPAAENTLNATDIVRKIETNCGKPLLNGFGCKLPVWNTRAQGRNSLTIRHRRAVCDIPATVPQQDAMRLRITWIARGFLVYL
jgi:hypothetical protein